MCFFRFEKRVKYVIRRILMENYEDIQLAENSEIEKYDDLS